MKQFNHYGSWADAIAACKTAADFVQTYCSRILSAGSKRIISGHVEDLLQALLETTVEQKYIDDIHGRFQRVPYTLHGFHLAAKSLLQDIGRSEI
jgi:hypothetical protein